MDKKFLEAEMAYNAKLHEAEMERKRESFAKKYGKKVSKWPT